MQPGQHLQAIARDAPAVRECARTAPGAPVAACPGWTAMDLAWHVGEVHRFWSTVVADRLADPRGYVEPARPETEGGVLAFNEESERALRQALAAADPATPVWTWSAQHDVAFVVRRMAQETAVHRVDAERAVGRDHRLDADLASDGIDEFLVHFLSDVADGAPELDGSVHVHCTDVAGEWLVTTDADGGYVVRREHAKGAAAVRGPAHDLLMVLWRRQPLDTVEVVGARDVAERFVARTNLE
jgi:uncharacterized protein (TIGR03083 family)